MFSIPGKILQAIININSATEKLELKGSLLLRNTNLGATELQWIHKSKAYAYYARCACSRSAPQPPGDKKEEQRKVHNESILYLNELKLYDMLTSLHPSTLASLKSCELDLKEERAEVILKFSDPKVMVEFVDDLDEEEQKKHTTLFTLIPDNFPPPLALAKINVSILFAMLNALYQGADDEEVKESVVTITVNEKYCRFKIPGDKNAQFKLGACRPHIPLLDHAGLTTPVVATMRLSLIKLLRILGIIMELAKSNLEFYFHFGENALLMSSESDLSLSEEIFIIATT